MSALDNPNAFPRSASWSPDGRQAISSQTGMTLRDWFAGQALAGWLSDPNVGGDPQSTAECVYRFADAMMAERAKVQS